MTFLSGWRLLLLVGPVALLVAYLVAQRARRRTVVRFTTVDMLASVAPRRPGWQRHVSAGALLAAVVLLVVAFAQPAHVIRTPRQRATVMMVIDVSGSMVADDVSPTRLDAARQAARSFTNSLPPGVQLGLLTFSTSASVQVAPTTDRSTILAALDALSAGGGTATGDAIDLALNAITALPPGADGKPAPAAIVLLSDGTPTIGHGDQSPTDAVAAADVAAKQAGVKISTIAFGTAAGTVTVGGRTLSVPSDPAAMAQIAADTGGRTFKAESASQLKSVYGQIGRAVGYDVHRHEITAWFTGIGLVLAMLAGAAALWWNERLV